MFQSQQMTLKLAREKELFFLLQNNEQKKLPSEIENIFWCQATWAAKNECCDVTSLDALVI